MIIIIIKNSSHLPQKQKEQWAVALVELVEIMVPSEVHVYNISHGRIYFHIHSSYDENVFKKWGEIM